MAAAGGINPIVLPILLLIIVHPDATRSACSMPSNTLIMVEENQYPGTVVFSFGTGPWTFALAGSMSNCTKLLCLFPTNNGSYELVLDVILDAETMPPANMFTIYCSRISYKMVMYIEDLNDNAPQFAGSPYNVSLSELSIVNTTVFTFKGKVHDNDVTPTHFTYGIVNDNSNGTFGFNKADVVLLKNLDFDTGPHSFTLEIIVQDDGAPSLSAITTLTFNIIDENDLGPEFSQNLYHIAIPENIPVGTAVAVQPPIHADNLDKNIITTIHYVIEDGNPQSYANYLELDPVSGQVKIIGGLDRTKATDYELLIKAYQVDKPRSHFDMAILRVDITGQNNHRPRMLQSLYRATIVENTRAGDNVLQVSAADDDNGMNGNFLFYLNGSTGAFVVDPYNGWIIVNNSQQLDRERKSRFWFQVYAQENVTLDRWRSNSSNIEISLIDENDNSPVFGKMKYIFHVNKTICHGAVVGKVTATDRDEGRNAMVHYSLPNSPDRKFQIDSTTGVILANICLADNYKPKYAIAIIAEDQSNTAKRRSLVMADVIVSDVNANRPVFPLSLYHVSISETTKVGAFVFHLKAVDRDQSDNLTYSVLNGDYGKQFHLKVENGGFSLLTAESLDREIQSSYLLTVEVTDGQHTATTTINITIEDANDNAPVFSAALYIFVIPEEVALGYHVGIVSAKDADAGKNSEIVYHILTHQSYFAIGNKTGTITVVRNIDAESSPPEFWIDVEASDEATIPLDTVTRVRVKIRDVNDNAPRFPSPAVYFTVPDDTPCHYLLYTAKTRDNDRDELNRRTSYAISDDHKQLFQITPDGNLTTRCPDGVTSLKGRNYTFKITAHNVNGFSNFSTLKGSQTIIIHVTDVHSMVPAFRRSEYNFTINEDASIDSMVGRVKADYTNSEAGHTDIKYELDGWNTTAIFYVDAMTGEIKIHRPIDFDPPANEHQFTLTIKARNSASNFHGAAVNFSQAIVHVIVRDVNDNAPVFGKVIYKVLVDEDLAVGSLVKSVQAVDKDSDAAGLVSYGLYSVEQVPFSVQAQTGQILLVRQLNYSDGQRSFTFEIIAKDGGVPQRSSWATINVLINRPSNSPPVFSTEVYHFLLKENEPSFTLFGHVTATDKDMDSLVYKMETLNSGFAIEKSTGDFYTLQPFDFDGSSAKMPTVKISVSDGLHRVTAHVAVYLIDQNDEPPVFTQPKYAARINETSSYGQRVLTVVAKDPDTGDGGKVTYQLLNGDGLFAIDSNSGLVTVGSMVVQRPFDPFFQNHYSLIVRAQDGGVPSLSALAIVEVTVYYKDVTSFDKIVVG